MAAPAPSRLGWRRGFAIYADRRVQLIAVLGFASGLPLALSFATLTAWLAQAGLTRTAIGLFALAGLPYALKFLWSPLVDGMRLPWFTARFGRRRGWMVASQIAVALAIGLLALSDPARDAVPTALLALLVAFLSATQDIVIDAFRIEILDEHEQGAGAAAIQLGYRIGMLTSGAGAFFIADAFGFPIAYMVMAGAMAVGLGATLCAKEPSPALRRRAAPGRGPGAWLRDHVTAPFADFMARPGWVAILGFIALYKLGDAVAGVMANPFYIDIGFSLTEIGAVTKAFGIAATLAGTLAGGVLVARTGILRALLWAGVLQMASNLMFVVQALVGADLTLLTVTIAVENVSGGLGTAAFVAFLSRLCSVEFTATQYALLSSFAAAGRTALSSGGGWLADALDWPWFFAASSAAALPGLIVLWWLIDRGRMGDRSARR